VINPFRRSSTIAPNGSASVLKSDEDKQPKSDPRRLWNASCWFNGRPAGDAAQRCGYDIPSLRCVSLVDGDLDHMVLLLNLNFAWRTPYDTTYDAEEGEDYEEITQEDCWTVISSFFDPKGLVCQQLDSFDEFVQNTMQELVDENAELVLDQADQHTGHDADMTRRYEIKFEQIYLSRPTVTEADESVVPVFPRRRGCGI
jgi:hypothetical protein